MYSTTTLIKNSKFSGRLMGTHQQLDLVARRLLTKHLGGKFFPSGKEIIYFEGTRGPDGLKRKSPGVDEPSHMLSPTDLKNYQTLDESLPANVSGHEKLDSPSVLTIILDHRWNLVEALRKKDHIRAAFEAAWMAHMITDGLTPAHHFPLSEIKDELMTEKDFFRIFGAPIKGIMHGRNFLETARNNWLYWGAKGHMNQHIAYEYGVVTITSSMPKKRWTPAMSAVDFSDILAGESGPYQAPNGPELAKALFQTSLDKIQKRHMYEKFREQGWTTELALETRSLLLPEIVRCIVLSWYSAAAEAYNLTQSKATAPHPTPSKTHSSAKPKEAHL